MGSCSSGPSTRVRGIAPESVLSDGLPTIERMFLFADRLRYWLGRADQAVDELLAGDFSDLSAESSEAFPMDGAGIALAPRTFAAAPRPASVSGTQQPTSRSHRRDLKRLPRPRRPGAVRQPPAVCVSPLPTPRGCRGNPLHASGVADKA